MKHLNNNFTTPEQSTRLLELGVPAWTADIMFDINRRRYDLIDPEDESWAETQRTLFYNGGAIPHWSVGRLQEIAKICTKEKEYYYISLDTVGRQEDFVEWWVKYFTLTDNVLFDFSKL